MDEHVTLQEMIANTVNAYCMQDGLGIPSGFVYCISRIDSEGRNVLTLGSADSQSTHISLGLTRYLSKNFEMDVEQELSECCYAMDEDED